MSGLRIIKADGEEMHRPHLFLLYLAAASFLCGTFVTWFWIA
jgi:hypothetical protein